MRQRGVSRVWVFLWAVLQFALPTAASYADAVLERTTVAAPASHVESAGSLTCRPVHPADCGLCQLATRHAVTSVSPSLPTIVSLVQAPAETRVAMPVAGERGRLPRTRAPPVA